MDLPKEIKGKIDVLYEDHMRSSRKKIRDMELNVRYVMNLRQDKIIGGDYTLLAVKNHSSFLIATFGKGITLVEKRLTKYSTQVKKRLLDMIYVEDLNCYFLSYGKKLYRKDIDDNPPYVYMEVHCGLRAGACFQYSKLNKRLIVNKAKKSIAVINLETCEVEIEIESEKTVGDEIFVFRLFEEKEDRVIAATKNGRILLYRVDFGKKEGTITTEFTFRLNSDREERIKSITVCSRSQNVLFEVGQFNPSSLCSRTCIAELIGEGLKVVSKLDLYSQKAGDKLALECYGYVGSHILWIGLTKDDQSRVRVFDFETKTGTLIELASKKVSAEDGFPIKIERFGEYFYYVGHFGRVKRISILI